MFDEFGGGGGTTSTSIPGNDFNPEDMLPTDDTTTVDNSTVASTNTGQTYERSNQDLNITENGIGNITYFHGVANPGALDGLQLNGADLHEALLTDSYNYSYGITQGNYQANVEISQGGFDLDGGLPTNGKYTNPDTGVGF